MANFTQTAIKESFLKILNDKPINQITVKDIVEDCGINRNSFYYHFQDIPALVEDIVKSEVDKVTNEYPSIDSIETCLTVSVDFAKANKRAVMHIYNSANRAMFEQYLWKVCEYVAEKYVNAVAYSESLEKADRALVTNLVKCECFGVVIQWMESGMSDEIYNDIHRLCEIRSGLSDVLTKSIIQ